MRKILLAHIIFCISFLGIAQNDVVPLNNEFIYPFEHQLYEKHKENFHSGVKPFLRKDISSFVGDSLLTPLKCWASEPIASSKDCNLSMNISPLIHGVSLYQAGENIRFNYSAGLYTSISGKKLGLSGWYRYGQFPRFPFQDTSLFMREAVNGIGMNQGADHAHHYEFYLNYSPNQYFDITAGNGKHFWGDGYRSFLLSDNPSPYPFLRIMSSFWNVRYTNLYAMHVDNNYNGFQRKFVSSHQLSWNIVKNLNFTLYETVIFAHKDTLGNRNFDVNYLNPIIFFRPVEYSIGSNDNVLFGGSLKYTLADKYTFYTQLVFDEFLLSAFRENNGWWANKYGVQFGFKTYNIANIDGLSYQLEYNFARPFTFAHKYSVLNYGHLGQSLAHPLGANFYELTQIIRYQKDRWYFRLQTQYQDRGDNTTSANYGGDIFRSYLDRAGNFGHTIGQGEQHFVWWNQLSVSYVILNKFNLRGFIDYTFRTDRTGGKTKINNLLQVGIRTSFWNTYNDY
ncbi:hypothetical protein [Parvicella tangerina]|uniref:Capsule assembly Wzi family protein n=1 Tax=Parvicella tangerina TaxID=2829795 RepID=A0A916JPC9_9FLAO|nr:hypothetical protein [Parvicella tangerina]CAG5085486.1 hypothetical protein CRYO30217_02771 [Parvicella tangerina]